MTVWFKSSDITPPGGHVVLVCGGTYESGPLPTAKPLYKRYLSSGDWSVVQTTPQKAFCATMLGASPAYWAHYDNMLLI